MTIAPPAPQWRWLVVYEDDHQHLEDLDATGEWRRAMESRAQHGRIVALQIISLVSGLSTLTVKVPADARPVMRRRRAIDLNLQTGEQWPVSGLPTIVGWERRKLVNTAKDKRHGRIVIGEEVTGVYLHCWPNGEVLMTDDVNVGAGHAAD